MFFKSTGLSGGWRRQRSIYALKELQTQLTFFIPIPDCLAMTGGPGENIMWARWKVRWARWKYQVDHVNLSATCYDRLGLEDLVLASWTHSLLSHFFSSSRFLRNSRLSSLGLGSEQLIWETCRHGLIWRLIWSWPLEEILSWHSSAPGWPNTNKQMLIQIQITNTNVTTNTNHTYK